jgi:4-amino-4-deoxy-L-arabinose transferase-like glycosyltransferase
MAASSRSLIYAAALLGLTLRLAFGFGYWIGEPLTRDEREYLSLARSITAGRGFVSDESTAGSGHDAFGRAPGYPLFLAAVGGGRAATEGVPAAVKIAQAVVGAAGVIMVATLAGRLAGPRAAGAAALIAAVYPPLVSVSARAFSEALFWPMGLAAAWCVDRALGDGSRQVWWGLASGVVGGLASLVRPAMLFFLPFAAARLLWRRAVGGAQLR